MFGFLDYEDNSCLLIAVSEFRLLLRFLQNCILVSLKMTAGFQSWIFILPRTVSMKWVIQIYCIA